MSRFYAKKAERGVTLPYCALRRRACHGVEAQTLVYRDWVEDFACSYDCLFCNSRRVLIPRSTDVLVRYI
jgi:hypothetical protein